MSGNANNSDLGGKCGDGLRTAILKREGTWPTPTAKDANGPWRTTHSPSLNAVLFPTPRALDAMSVGPGPNGRQVNGRDAYRKLNVEAVRSAATSPAPTYDTPTAPGNAGSGRKGSMPEFAQLNPDWVEWLMGWPVGWTDPECGRPWPFLPLGADPADLPPAMPGHVPRVTARRDSRAARIRALGNGQVPQCASAAFRIGLALLDSWTPLYNAA